MYFDRQSEKMNNKLRSSYITMEQKETLVEMMKKKSLVKIGQIFGNIYDKECTKNVESTPR